MRRAASFVITLWLEPTQGDGESEWRWRVVEGPSGTPHYFRRLTDVLSFVSDRTGVKAPA